jgi:hypothetical protein
MLNRCKRIATLAYGFYTRCGCKLVESLRLAYEITKPRRREWEDLEIR